MADGMIFLFFAYQVWLNQQKGKGLEIKGSFQRQNGQIILEMSLTNHSMQQLSGFAIQFNKNRLATLLWELSARCMRRSFYFFLSYSFGLLPAGPLKVNPVSPNTTVTTSLQLNTNGTVQKMNPVNNLQVNYCSFIQSHYCHSGDSLA